MDAVARQHALEAAIDESSSPSVIDVAQLRELCVQGPLPDEPALLRQRIWRVLLGVLPPEKALWRSYALSNQRRYFVRSDVSR